MATPATNNQQFFTYKGQVKLGQNQSLHFTPGHGYWAGLRVTTVRPRMAAPELVSENGRWTPSVGQGGGGGYRPSPGVISFPNHPAVAPPTPPVDPYGPSTPGEIDARASSIAQGQLDPQEAEARRQQAVAQQQAAADEAAIQGFQTAVAQIEQGMVPQVQGAFAAAAKEQGQLGQGIASGTASDVQGAENADQAFAASQGQTTQDTTNTGDMGAALYAVGGKNPGDAIATEGAAETAWTAQQPLIALNAGREELDARMAQARTDNDGYAQQLIQIAAQFPDLKAQALQQLNQYELDKANYRRGIASDAEQKRVDTANIASQRRQDSTQARAETASEKAAGITATNQKGELAYKWASLTFQSQKAAQAAQAATKKGKTIDVQASKLLGHIVYKDGSEDPTIKVKQTTASTPQQKAQVNRAKATSAARVTAFKYATSLQGKPTAVSAKDSAAARALGKKTGKYIADSSQKYGVPGGVFPPAYAGGPATTNDPSRAVRTGGGATNYADAQQKVWAEIDGDGLMSRYGYSREQVMAIVNRALSAAGWRKR